MSVMVRNNVNVLGEGQRAMIFMHGFGCDQNVWRHVSPSFEKDWRIVLFDHVGAGKSDLSQYDADKYATLQGYADDLIEIVRELKLEQPVVIGHSVSAMIAVLAANKEPAMFSGLVLIGPSPSFLNDGDYQGGFERKDIEDLLAAMDDNFFGWSSMITPVIMGNPDRPELAGELGESFCRTDPTIARHFARVTFLSDSREDLGKVTIPSLILQCSADALAPLGVGEYLNQRIHGSTLALLKATGHCPHLSEPAEVIAVTQNWLDASIKHVDPVGFPAA